MQTQLKVGSIILRPWNVHHRFLMSQFLNGDIPEHVVYYKKVKIGFHIIKCINDEHTGQGLRRNDTRVVLNNDTFCEVMAILNVADTSTE